MRQLASLTAPFLACLGLILERKRCARTPSVSPPSNSNRSLWSYNKFLYNCLKKDFTGTCHDHANKPQTRNATPSARTTTAGYAGGAMTHRRLDGKSPAAFIGRGARCDPGSRQVYPPCWTEERV